MKAFRKNQFFNIFLLLIIVFVALPGYTQKHVEQLDRGLVAVPVDEDKVFISWRLLGTESHQTAFNLYRGSQKLNEAPITETTNFIDSSSTGAAATYKVQPIINGKKTAFSAPAEVWNNQYKKIPIKRPAGGTTPDGVKYDYTANDASVGDLDGDGEYEVVLKWNPTNAKDNSHEGYSGKVFIDAYEMDGTQLWRLDLGQNIRAGAHYTQFVVYDLDSDGKAEVALKTADGTIDGAGEVIGDAEADYRSDSGYIVSGPEYLTIFDGQTGAALATTDYLPARGNVCDWGDCYGNRVDRFLAGVAYLDGKHPSLIMTRGYYTRSVLAAWDWKNGTLNNRWIFDTDDAGNEEFAGQGNHQLSAGDVDGDGKDEIMFGAMAVDNDGTGMYSTGLNHGDAMHLSDLDPKNPGQELFQIHEDKNTAGASMRDAATGDILWATKVGDVGRGIAVDVDPRFYGAEAWGFGEMRNIKGETISEESPYANFSIWWDGDLSRELLNGTKIDKWNYNNETLDPIVDFGEIGAKRINGSKLNPNLIADILGDWREEVLFRNSDDSALILATTTIPTTYKLPTLMHNPQYRISVASQNTGYNQPPHPSFFLGTDMEVSKIQKDQEIISVKLTTDN